MTVLFRSCGGLGNQLFQLLAVRLLADHFGARAIHHYHEHRYQRIAHWEYPFASDLKPANAMHRLILRLRIPQVLKRLGIRSADYAKVGGVLIVDGYFQRSSDYRAFSPEALARQLQRLRDELGIVPAAVNDCLFHVRLGDYFKGEEAELEQLVRILKHDRCAGADMISNRDSLIPVFELRYPGRLVQAGINYLPTSDMDACALVRMAAAYRTIVSNGSTLTYWSAVLGQRQLVFDSELIASEALRRNCNGLEEVLHVLRPLNQTV